MTTPEIKACLQKLLRWQMRPGLTSVIPEISPTGRWVRWSDLERALEELGNESPAVEPADK